MNVWINGKEYVLRPGTRVTTAPLPDFAEQYRTQGRQQRADRSGISSWEFSDTSKGLGAKHMGINDADEAKSIYDSLAWTHIPGQWTPPAMFITPSIHAAAAHSKVTHLLPWRNNLYGIVQPSGAPIGSANVYQYTAAANSFDASLGPLVKVASLSGPVLPLNHILDLKVSENSIYGAVRDGLANAPVIGAFVSEGVGSIAWHWLVGSPGVGTLPNAAQLGTDNEGQNRPWLMLSTPSQCMMLVASGASNKATVADGNPLGTMSTRLENVASLSFLGVPSAYECYNSPMVNRGSYPLVVTPDGLYQLDYALAGFSAPIQTKLLDWANSPEFNPQAVNYRDFIYCKVGNQLIEYDIAAALPSEAGFGRRDGLPKGATENGITRYALHGEITALYPTWKYLFAGVYSGTSSASTIMAYSRDTDAWHLIAKCPSPNLAVNRMLITSLPDGAERLWVIWRNVTGNHNNEYPSFIFNPLSNPLSAPTHAYATYGRIVWPNFDGGIPDVKGVWAGFGVDGEGIGSLHRAELLLQPDNTGSLHTAGTLNTVPFYGRIKNGAGLVANMVQPHLELYRGTAAATAPVIRALTMDYLKVPSTRMSYEFEVDVELTSNRHLVPPEQVISDLEGIRDFTSEIPTFWYGRVPTRRVIIPPGQIVNLENLPDERDFPGQREAYVKMKLQELI